jgi:hypothetical protein
MNGLSICETPNFWECHTERSRLSSREREKVLRGTSGQDSHQEHVGSCEAKGPQM